jgi:hypothetical protein
MGQQPGSVAVNHGGLWIPRQQFESAPGYFFLEPFFSCSSRELRARGTLLESREKKFMAGGLPVCYAINAERMQARKIAPNIPAPPMLT